MVTISNATPRPPHLVDSLPGNGPEEVLHVRVSPETGPHLCHITDARVSGTGGWERLTLERLDCPSCPVKILVPAGLSLAW